MFARDYEVSLLRREVHGLERRCWDLEQRHQALLKYFDLREAKPHELLPRLEKEECVCAAQEPGEPIFTEGR